MTFAVVTVEDNARKVIGTVWAESEAAAQELVPVIEPAKGEQPVSLCPTDEREIPLRLRATHSGLC